MKKLIVKVIRSGLRLGRPLAPLDKSVVRMGEICSISLSVCPDIDRTVPDPTLCRPPRDETLSSPMAENHGPASDLTHQYHKRPPSSSTDDPGAELESELTGTHMRR